MKPTKLAFACALAVCLLGGLARAQDDVSKMIPEGTYKDTCTGCFIDVADNSKLSCSCKDKKGNSKATALYGLALCEKQPWNDNGNLTCTLKGGFKKSCKDIGRSGTSVTANCKNKKGKYQKTDLDLTKCAEDNIDNCDGKLVCGYCP